MHGGNCLVGTWFSPGGMKMFWNSIQVVVVQRYECTKCTAL